MPEGINSQNSPEVEHGDDGSFEIELTDDELKELMDKQGEMKDSAFGVSVNEFKAAVAEDNFNKPNFERKLARKIADEVKLLIEQNSSALGIDSSKLVIKKSGTGDAICMVGSSEVGYINISVSGGDLHLRIPPTFNAISEMIRQGANHVFDGGGKVGPRGV